MARIEAPEYMKSDFLELLIPIFDVPEGESIMDRFGSNELDYPEFHTILGPFGFEAGDKDRVIQWICCVYDTGSPFIKDFPDVNYRKLTAALYVGFKTGKDRKFKKHIEEMLIGNCEPVVDMIIRYCRGYNSPDYSFLVAISDDYYRILKEIQIGGEYSFDQVKKMREEIKKLSKEFFSGDNSSALKSKLYKEIEKESLELRPEDIANKITDGLPTITKEEISNHRSEYIVEVQPTRGKSGS